MSSAAAASCTEQAPSAIGLWSGHADEGLEVGGRACVGAAHPSTVGVQAGISHQLHGPDSATTPIRLAPRGRSGGPRGRLRRVSHVKREWEDEPSKALAMLAFAASTAWVARRGRPAAPPSSRHGTPGHERDEFRIRGGARGRGWAETAFVGQLAEARFCARRGLTVVNLRCSLPLREAELKRPHVPRLFAISGASIRYFGPFLVFACFRSRFPGSGQERRVLLARNTRVQSSKRKWPVRVVYG
jgi:hypothetical protein